MCVCVHIVCACAQSLHLCPTLCDTMDSSLPGSSLHGILQARILEWVAMPSSRGSPKPGTEPGSPAFQVESLPLSRRYILHCIKCFWYLVGWHHRLNEHEFEQTLGDGEGQGSWTCFGINFSALSFLHSPTLTSTHDPWKQHKKSWTLLSDWTTTTI